MLRMRGGVVGGNRVLCVCASERVSMYELESTIYIYSSGICECNVCMYNDNIVTVQVSENNKTFFNHNGH